MTIILVLVAIATAISAQTPQYDLLLKGGHVIDPANRINEPMDVAVAGRTVAAVQKNIPESSAARVVNVSGLYVAPGFIDIHGHYGLGRPGSGDMYPPDMNLSSGMTTLVDAGTWGADDFDVMKRTIIDRSRIRVLAFLNIVSAGMTDDAREHDPKLMDAARCAEIAKKYKDVIVGIKTAHYWTSQPLDKEHPLWEAVDRAVEAGRLADMPVMVDFWPRPPERSYEELILKKLRPGDIHTHVFAQQFPIVNEDGKLNQALVEARRRGVYFDLSHGAGSFWWRNAVPAIRQGFIPDSISTDLHMGNVNGPVVDMITTMSKVLVMGVPLEDVIRRSTVNPAKEIRHPELGTLTVGREADIAVFELRRGKFGYTDCGRAKLIGNVKLENRITVRAGRIAYDPTGISMPEWEKAPKQYFTTPKLQSDPPAMAVPNSSRDSRNPAKP